MAKDEFIFVEKKLNVLEAMTSEAVAKEAAALTAFKDSFMDEYRERMKKYDALIARKQKEEKNARDADPQYQKLAQGIGR